MPPFSHLSERMQTLEASKIREVAEMGMKLGDAIPLWFGEGAWPTSNRIVDAAIDALKSGNHKYQPNNGAMNLREEICRYSNGLFGCELTTEQVTITPSGMQGLSLAAQSLVTPGDRVVVLSPGWPNISGAFQAAGARIQTVALAPKHEHWHLDVNQLLDALQPGTKAVVLNSPNNPTGWTMTDDDQNIVLNHCRAHGIWIVADDVYSRLYRHGRSAPSFLNLSNADDLLISVNSFSKCWSMTGWRLGWMITPAEIEQNLGQLTEFNTSCTPGFIQDAGLVALKEGEHEVQELLAKIQSGYDITAQALSSFSRVEFIQPDGAFYCFFKVDGLTDSFSAAKQILNKTRVGLAPGVAFGPEGEGYLRLCYAQPETVLNDAFDRLGEFLN